jgi:hypothetical protein
MARNQFSFQKRQKELAKKKKREEKLARRLERKQDGVEGAGIATVNEFGEVIDAPVDDEKSDAAESETETPA